LINQENDLSVIVPVRNRKNLTRNFLKSIREQTNKNFQTIIIDDGSTDGTFEMIKDEFPEVYVIKGDGNLWWTGAINLGVKKALKSNPSALITLNDDLVLDEKYMENMLKWHKKLPTAMFGSLLINNLTGIPFYAGINFKWGDLRPANIVGNKSTDELKGITKISLYPGRGILIPSVIFKKIGLYDEKTFPHYSADEDFVLRAKKQGFELFANFDSKIYSYPNEKSENFSLSGFFTYLFGRKGRGNIGNYTKFICRHAPKKYIPKILLYGYITRIIGYPISMLSINRK